MRPGYAVPPELLMIERAATMAFAAGALVFPGGRIDPGDHALAAMLADAPCDAAARIAAIRETIEEVGVAVGLDPAPAVPTIPISPKPLTPIGRDMAAMLAVHQLRLDLSALTPFARWQPNFAEIRTFDARFYLAQAPVGADALPMAVKASVRSGRAPKPSSPITPQATII